MLTTPKPLVSAVPNPTHHETTQHPRSRPSGVSQGHVALTPPPTQPSPRRRSDPARWRALCLLGVTLILASACSPSSRDKAPSQALSPSPWTCPDGAIVPRLVVPDVALAVGFYQRALGASSEATLTGGDVVMTFGEAHFVVTSGGDDDWLRSPEELGGTSTGLLLYVPDADALSARAVQAGARARMSAQHAWWGDRYAQVIDPFGHRWGLATRIEAPDEGILARRAAAALAREPWRHHQAPPAAEFRPKGYPALIAVLVAEDAQRAASHYRRALGAQSALRVPHPSGGVLHEDLQLGASVFMLDQAADFLYPRPPETLGGASVSLMFCREGFQGLDRDDNGYPWRGPFSER